MSLFQNCFSWFYYIATHFLIYRHVMMYLYIYIYVIFSYTHTYTHLFFPIIMFASIVTSTRTIGCFSTYVLRTMFFQIHYPLGRTQTLNLDIVPRFFSHMQEVQFLICFIFSVVSLLTHFPMPLITHLIQNP